MKKEAPNNQSLLLFTRPARGGLSVCAHVALREAAFGPERSPWLAAFESGVGGKAVTGADDRRGRV